MAAYFRALQQAGAPLRRLYVSHLQRSQQTAQAVAHAIGASPVVKPAIAEIGLGAWEGLTPEEIDARFDGGYARWKATPSLISIPGAEPLAQFRARVRQAFGAIVAAHQSDREEVIVVTHGGVIASLLADCVDADYDRVLRGVSLDNGGISAVSCRALPPVVLWINATAHLDNGHASAAEATSTMALFSSPASPASSSRASQP